MKSHPVVHLDQLTKNFVLGDESVPVLKGVDLIVNHGDFTAIMGASGSGKSTLLHILGCLDRPTTGSYLLDGRAVDQLTDRQLSRMRNSYVGFVFQEFNLLAEATVYENVALPFVYSGLDPARSRQRITQAVEQVGLAHRLAHRPAALSGGERQRVAIARAVAVQPKLILADEPTGNLDSATSREILALFGRMHDLGASIVLVTHDRDVAAAADTILVMADGLLSPGL
jgi:putative ABC transport system ATP-binding protein